MGRPDREALRDRDARGVLTAPAEPSGDRDLAIALARELLHGAAALRVGIALDAEPPAIVECERFGAVVVCEHDAQLELAHDAGAGVQLPQLPPMRPLPPFEVDADTGAVAGVLGGLEMLARAVRELAALLPGQSVVAAEFETTDPDCPLGLAGRAGEPVVVLLGEHGVELDRALEARRQLDGAAAYLELHIEQGPVLESLDLPLGVVLGTYGCERHGITWRGQAAHAGSTPMDKRRDALAGAAKLALEIREIAKRTGDGAVCTSGNVVCKPGIVTSVVETAEQLLDQRHLDAEKLAGMLAEAKEASKRFAGEEDVEVSWGRIWAIEPILFDEALLELADEAVREVAGTSHRLPSGPLHDAAEVSRAGVPTVMLFVQSLRGLSHTKLEDTKEEHLELSVQALDRLASKTIDWLAGGRT